MKTPRNSPPLVLLLLPALVASMAIVACAPAAEEAPPARVRLEGATAAIVNDEPVFTSDVELEAVAQGFIAPGDAFPSDHPEYKTVLDQLIDQRLLAQEAVKRGLDDDEDARHRLAVARERILGNLLVENLVAAQVNEDAITEMYAEQVRLQQLGDEVRISLITVDDAETAEIIITEYEAGKDFPSLAVQYSTDGSTRLEGGDLGYIGPADQQAPFSSIIANTPVGEISPAFESDDGWHVLKVEDRRQKAPKTLEEMRSDIITFLTYSEINTVLRQLRTSGDITLTKPGTPTAPATPEDEPAGN